jgi:hypothetical protein
MPTANEIQTPAVSSMSMTARAPMRSESGGIAR